MLTAFEADLINQPISTELQLNSDEQRGALKSFFGNENPVRDLSVSIRDNNNDGKVSMDDTAILVERHPQVSGPFEVKRIFLDKEAVGRFNQESKPEIPLSLDTNTVNALKDRFSFNGPSATIIDKDNNGKISAGDILRLTVPSTGALVLEVAISQKDADVINGDVDMLELTPNQNKALEGLLNTV